MVAGLLMVGGIALLGVITGTIASWLVEKLSGVEQQLERADEALLTEVRSLRSELAELRAEINAKGSAEHA